MFFCNSRITDELVKLGPFICKSLICLIIETHKPRQINFSNNNKITKLGKGMSNLVVNCIYIYIVFILGGRFNYKP